MDCPLCGDPLPEKRPYYYITLGTGETNTNIDQKKRRVCEQCWEEYRTKLF